MVERISTEYSVKNNEVEDIISYLEKKGIYVMRIQRGKSLDYELFRVNGICHIQSGSIKNRRTLFVDYKSEELLEMVEDYRKQKASRSS